MLVFPNAKINIGLNILFRRIDGFHEIQTIFYPIGLKDALEFIENHSNQINFSCSGIQIDSLPQNNLVLKAYHLLSKCVKLPGLDIHLHKAIPFGAGLGGGSSDAAFFLKTLNEKLELGLSPEDLKHLSLQLGADCSFFLQNQPAIATGIGEELQSTSVDLKGYYLALIKPSFSVNTKEAYAGVIPKQSTSSPEEFLSKKPEEWMGFIKNDFEFTVFQRYPEIGAIKESLLDQGAVYASMSGSGSSVYGIFKNDPDLSVIPKKEGYFFWKELL